MNIRKYPFFLLSALLLLLWACDNEEDRAILKMGEAPQLSTSVSELVLSEDNAGQEAVSLQWNAADFGFQAAVNYSLEIDTAANNFATPYEMNLGNQSQKSFGVAELNQLLGKLNYEAGVAHEMSMRLKASVSDNTENMYSNVVSMSVTPYSTFVEPGYLYVPGGYQGWDPGSAPALVSAENNDVYEGLISFVGADNLEFKFTPKQNWDADFGNGDTEGSLVAKGANLTVPTADTYLLSADLNNNTWSASLNSWGVIGDATPGGWESDTNLRYNNELQQWELETELTAGKIKFRFNDDWGTNFGDDDTSDAALNAGGADIPVAEAGTYLIVFSIDNESGEASYELNRQ